MQANYKLCRGRILDERRVYIGNSIPIALAGDMGILWEWEVLL